MEKNQVDYFLHLQGYTYFDMGKLTMVEVDNLLDAHKKSVTEKEYKWFHSVAMLLKS